MACATTLGASTPRRHEPSPPPQPSSEVGCFRLRTRLVPNSGKPEFGASRGRERTARVARCRSAALVEHELVADAGDGRDHRLMSADQLAAQPRDQRVDGAHVDSVCRLLTTSIRYSRLSGRPSAPTSAASRSNSANPTGMGGGLADNGGPVATVALAQLRSNLAIDTGDNSLDAPADARGAARADVPGVAHNGASISDLGPFEVQASGALEAESLVVTTADDVLDWTDGVTSLREALVSPTARRAAAMRSATSCPTSSPSRRLSPGRR